MEGNWAIHDQNLQQSKPWFSKPGYSAYITPCTWTAWKFGGEEIARWATAALEVPYTEEVGQSTVSALLQIASINSLQAYIPLNLWSLLRKHHLSHLNAWEDHWGLG